jgi:hypothetical protein
VPFGFLKRREHDESTTAADATIDPASIHAGSKRGVKFTALTEDWRLTGRMDIAGRLSDALNRREAIAISDVAWGPPDGSAPLEAASGLQSLDPYDLILVTAGEDSLPPLSEPERAAVKVHKVAYDLVLEVPPFHVVGKVYLHPGAAPERLLERSTEMFVPVVDPVATLGDVQVSDPVVEVILVNRFYLRAVTQANGFEARAQSPVAADLPEPEPETTGS